MATEFLRMNQSCLTFWYHAQGQNLGKLEVYLRHGPHENLTATTYLFATGGANYVHEWNQVKANISHVTPGGLIKVGVRVDQLNFFLWNFVFRHNCG